MVSAMTPLAGGRPLPHWARRSWTVDRPALLLGALALVTLLLRVAWLDQPPDRRIFDESYYVTAARVILGHDVGPPYRYVDAPAGIDPNREHPPLGKVAIAASIELVGDGPLGWRLPSLIAGMAALLAMAGIARAAGETAWVGVLAVALVATDPLSFAQGRIGMLDMLALGPALVGAWLALRHHWVLAGVAFAAGTLCKLTGAFGLAAAIATLGTIWLTHRHDPVARSEAVRGSLLSIVAFGLAFMGGLWILDVAVTGFSTPWDHVLAMLRIGRIQTGAQLDSSEPWEWLVDRGAFDYVAVDPRAANGVAPTTLVFRAAVNPLLLILGAPALVVCSVMAWHGHRLAAWAVCWTAATFVPYLLLAAIDRTMYLYYMLPVVPGLAVAVALLLTRARIPRPMAIAAVAASAIVFLALFPFWPLL